MLLYGCVSLWHVEVRRADGWKEVTVCCASEEVKIQTKPAFHLSSASLILIRGCEQLKLNLVAIRKKAGNIYIRLPVKQSDKDKQPDTLTFTPTGSLLSQSSIFRLQEHQIEVNYSREHANSLREAPVTTAGMKNPLL